MCLAMRFHPATRRQRPPSTPSRNCFQGPIQVLCLVSLLFGCFVFRYESLTEPRPRPRQRPAQVSARAKPGPAARYDATTRPAAIRADPKAVLPSRVRQQSDIAPAAAPVALSPDLAASGAASTADAGVDEDDLWGDDDDADTL